MLIILVKYFSTLILIYFVNGKLMFCWIWLFFCRGLSTHGIQSQYPLNLQQKTVINKVNSFIHLFQILQAQISQIWRVNLVMRAMTMVLLVVSIFKKEHFQVLNPWHLIYAWSCCNEQKKYKKTLVNNPCSFIKKTKTKQEQ